MGNPSSIQYSGTGMNAFFGQALTAGEAWPRRELSSYTRTINYDQRSAREELNFAQPAFGGQQQNTQVNGDKAWNVGPNGPAPQLAAAEERQLHIWLTPHGFLKGALAAGNATLVGSRGRQRRSRSRRSASTRWTARSTRSNHVTQSRDHDRQPRARGHGRRRDLLRLQGFQRRPVSRARSRSMQGGFPLWELTITSVTPNAPLDLPVPEAVAAATIPPVQTMSTKLADGVWHVTGGSHHSVVVEFNDYLAVVEAPLNEERSLAVIAEAKKLAPNKPIRYVLTTHHHFDHTGGLRTYVAEGATIVTHQSNVPYFEKTLTAPATLMPDMQAKNREAADVPGRVGQARDHRWQADDRGLCDGGRHAHQRYTLVYLPGPRILVEGDAYSPGTAGRAAAGDAAAQCRQAVRRHPATEAERRHHRADPRTRRGSIRGAEKVHRARVNQQGGRVPTGPALSEQGRGDARVPRGCCRLQP